MRVPGAAGCQRAREELEALLGEPVAELTGSIRTDAERAAEARSPARTVSWLAPRRRCIGSDRADAVAFLDFDQELTWPHVSGPPSRRSGSLAPCGRMLGAAVARSPARGADPAAGPPGRLRRPVEPTPTGWSSSERPLRRGTRPPAGIGAGASSRARRRRVRRGARVTVRRRGRWARPDGPWRLVRAPNHEVLCDALEADARPAGPPPHRGRPAPNLIPHTGIWIATPRLPLPREREAADWRCGWSAWNPTHRQVPPWGGGGGGGCHKGTEFWEGGGEATRWVQELPLSNVIATNG